MWQNNMVTANRGKGNRGGTRGENRVTANRGRGTRGGTRGGITG